LLEHFTGRPERWLLRYLAVSGVRKTSERGSTATRIMPAGDELDRGLICHIDMKNNRSRAVVNKVSLKGKKSTMIEVFFLGRRGGKKE